MDPGLSPSPEHGVGQSVSDSLTPVEHNLLNAELEARKDEHRKLCSIDPQQPPFREDVEVQEIRMTIRYGHLKAQRSSLQPRGQNDADNNRKRVGSVCS